MPESIHPHSNRESLPPPPGEQFPTEQELREFESVVENTPPPIGAYSIEDIAEDPDNPTPEELHRVEVSHIGYLGEGPPTFEDWFGYPDPRSSDDQGPHSDQQEPEDQAR